MVKSSTQRNVSTASHAMGTDETPSTTRGAAILNLPNKGKRGSVLATISQRKAEQLALKNSVTGEAAKLLATAAKLYETGAGKENEARETADKAAILVYRARVAGAISADEQTELLGQSFGFKGKGNDKGKRVKPGSPNASKTPYGQGEAIRKRVNRAVEAAEFASGSTDVSSFYDGLKVEDVQAEIQKMEAGTNSIWTVYDNLGKLRSSAAGKVNAAFNPKAIENIVNALSSDDAPQTWADNPELMAQYAALLDVIMLVDEAAAAIVSEREAAAA